MLFPLKTITIFFVLSLLHLVYSNSKSKIIANCPSSKMCPPGWSVQRQKMSKESIAVTCEVGVKKCDKPYSCVASYCGLKFCCANDRVLKNIEDMSKEVEDYENYDDQDSEEIDINGKKRNKLKNYEL
uniref:WAP domain-containing protein n=1 Tax=Strongyloides venezuelensis TaxID=75913 RepID=A0A0K0FFM6_STRVS